MANKQVEPNFTERINLLLHTNVDFLKLLKDERFTVKEQADKLIKLAIKNLGKRKRRPVDEDALNSFKEDWTAFLKSKECEIYFNQSNLNQEYILEDLEEKLYRTGVKRKYNNSLHKSNMRDFNIIKQEDDDDDKENEILLSQESNSTISSVDYKSSNTTRTLMLPDEDDLSDIIEDMSDGEKWFVEDFDLSDYLLRYRTDSLRYNIYKQHKELSPPRLMAQSNIYYFTKDPENSCIRDLPSNLIDTAYGDLNISKNHEQVPTQVSNDIEVIIRAIQSKDEALVMSECGRIMVENAKHNDSQNNLIKYTNVLVEVGKSMSKQVTPTRQNLHEGSYGEDTFVHDTVAPFFNNIFYGLNIKHKWANVKLAASASTSGNSNFFPDYTLYAFMRDIRFDLLVVEVKQPNSGNGFIDEKKLPNEMKAMLNKLIEHQMENPVVCGIKIDGFSATTYMMDLCYNGIYRLVEIDSFTFPSCVDDIYKIRQIVPSLIKLLASILLKEGSL